MFNDAALKDLFNYALDEPLNWWRIRGLDHLMFVGFINFLARQRNPPAEEAAVPPVAAREAAAPPVVAEEAALPPEAPEEAEAPRSLKRRRRRKNGPASAPPEAEEDAAAPQRWPTMLQHPQGQLTMLQCPALGNGGGGGRRLPPSHMARRPSRSPLLGRRLSLSRPSSLPCQLHP